MSRTEKNLPTDAIAQMVTPATRHEAIPTLLEFLASNGSKWCRISIKPTKVSMSFKANNKTFHYGTGKNLPEAYAMLQHRVTTFAI